MNSTEVSKQLSGDSTGYNFNINLPDWSSNSNDSALVEKQIELQKQKQRNQLIIARVVLAVVVLAFFIVRKKNK